jgi:hypothetical protein
MPGIVSSKTRSLYQRPPAGPVALNRACPQAQGLVAFWPLNGTGGRDHGDLRQDLTPTGTTQAGGPPDGGHALDFNGTTDKLENSSMTFPAVTQLSVSCWFWADTSAANMPLVMITDSGSGTRRTLFLRGAEGDEVQLRVSGGVFANASRAFGTGRWQLATGVQAAAEMRAFVDGGNKGVVATTLSYTPAKVQVGTWDADSNWHDGKIAHVCLWTRALSDGEVWRLYDPATRWELYYQLGRRAWSFPTAPAVGAAITGTATAAISEDDVVAGGKTIVITLTGDTWIAS